MRRLLIVGVVGVALVGTACTRIKPAPSTSTSVCLPASDTVSLTALPVGDGCKSTSPAVGYLWSCQTNFPAGNAGATAQGWWFNGDGTFNLTTKGVVDGSVSWPSSFSISLAGSTRVFTGNGLPDHTTGTFPISTTDDVYPYDRNPNSIGATTVSVSVPANPTLTGSARCVQGGPIGVMLNGVVLYNPTDAGGRDAVAWEAQDSCDGHPQAQHQYHYHSLSDCLVDTQSEAGGHSDLLGYAFDGFGIYGHYGENGEELTNTDLDACHGHTHTITWDGQQVSMYHYHATNEYPYVIGCFRG